MFDIAGVDNPPELVKTFINIFFYILSTALTNLDEITLDEPVNVVGDVAGVGVTIKLVGAPPFVPIENATDDLPLLYARPEGVSVATTEVGTVGAAAIGNHPFAGKGAGAGEQGRHRA